MPTYRVSPEMRRLMKPGRYKTQGDGFSLPQGQGHGPTPDNLMGQEATERTLRNLNNPMPFGGNQ